MPSDPSLPRVLVEYSVWRRSLSLPVLLSAASSRHAEEGKRDSFTQTPTGRSQFFV